MEQRKLDIINATIDIVAEGSMTGLNMRAVADKCKLNLNSIYRIFPSKEDLLYECFLMVNKEIGDLFKDIKFKGLPTRKNVLNFIHDTWVTYFNFMVKNGNHSLFYYIYRESPNLDRILMKNNETTAKDMRDFNNLFEKTVHSASSFLKDLPEDYFWLFLLEGTGIFVKKVIARKIDYTEDDVENIYQLLTQGLISFAK